MSFYSDSDDDSDASDAGVPSSQFQDGYNNGFGGRSNHTANNNSFQQQSSDDEEASSASDSSDDDDEPAAAVQPRGKTFRPPVGDGDSSSSSEDEADVDVDADSKQQQQPSSDNDDDDDAAASAVPAINPNPGPPRGKELRLIMNANASSSDDDMPISKKKKRKTTSTSKAKAKSPPKASTNGTRKKGSSASKKTSAKASAKKSSSTKAASKKRKTPPAKNDSDSDSEDEDCVATIIGGSDAEGAVAVAEVVSSSSSKRAKGENDAAKKKDGTLKRKPGPKKGSKKPATTKKGSKKPSASSAPSPAGSMPEVSAEKAVAAASARNSLQEAVTRLPHRISDSHVVRSFGRIKPELDVVNPLDALYSSPHAIHPVGFSCDRFEFSPVHGRVIKMRCDILDGSSLREQREGMKKEKEKDEANNVKSENNSEPVLVDEKVLSPKDVTGDIDNLGNGPVFRVTWGEGVEEDKLLEPSCPFDPYVASVNLGAGDVDAIAVPLSSKKGKPAGLPEVGMRVSVRFDKGKMYGGSIRKVEPVEPVGKKGKNKKVICNITIRYDDGAKEVAAFPDPDIVVAYQGCPPVETGNGLVTEMNGKTVRSALGKTPLEAWGKTLLSLGLIDEIMYGAALRELQSAREDGFNEVKDKLDAVNKKRRDDRAKEKSHCSTPSRHSFDGDDDRSQGTNPDGAMHMTELDDNQEDPSSEEVELRQQLAELRDNLQSAKLRSKAASLDLANARIATISPFAANPFLCRIDSESTESSWLAAAIRKERAKMGNTGNKRKIANPATMMDKNDTFFVPKIEKLVEGLPGTEFAPAYIFHSNRNSSVNSQAWVHKAKLNHQKEQNKKVEKAAKVAQQAEAKAIAKAKIEKERELKRKLKEEEVENRKRQREEEEERRKRERIEKRLSQLGLQMNERLFKEACMMREKNIMNFVRGLNKEFTRRRRAAEVAVGNMIERSSTPPPSTNTLSSILAPFRETLPPLSQPYDVEVVRVWDFLHSFSDAFSKPDTPTSFPSLNALQDAINCLKSVACEEGKRSDAIGLFKGIAIDLCKVISPSLTKILSSSTPNIEAIGNNGTDGGPQEDTDVSCLPVTEWSWREIARMVIMYDVLTDLGYSKQEAANLVKGYRSGGHPNSKEAKRWKKIEESPVTMMYHRLDDQDGFINFRRRVVRTNLSTPSTPSSVPSDWRFFLHNVKSRSTNTPRFMKDNVRKALAALKQNQSEWKGAETYIVELEKSLAILERSGHGNGNAPELHKAKTIAVSVLDSTREIFSLSLLNGNQETTQNCQAQLLENQADATQEPSRQKMGFQRMYQMSKDEFKVLEQAKEEYMAAALRLKEELERKDKDEANDDDDDDDEDEEMEDIEDNSQAEKSDQDPHSAEKKDVPNGEVNATAIMDSRTSADSAGKKVENDVPCKSNSEVEPKNADKASEDCASSSKPDGTAAEAVEAEKDEADQEDDEAEKAETDPEAGASSDNPNDPPVAVDYIPLNLGHPTLSEKDAHIPAELAEGLPKGWVARRIPRPNPNDKRTDRYFYSPKLGLKFRAKADVTRFIAILESTDGDEVAAIMEYHGRKKTSKATSKAVPNKTVNKVTVGDDEAGTNKNEYDFCEDVPFAPNLIRRCLAVIRSLCASTSADQFLYPVDPQLYPSYYETVMHPASLYDIGNFLQEAGTKFSANHDDSEIEEVVATVGRKVRTISSNTICVNSSNFLVNSAEEMLRIFERLMFDWVLAPSSSRPELEDLDDDRCIDHHESDVNSMVLLCDACEGKYNMNRLKPPLLHVPSGDWYCPRCVSGRSWLTVDPRIGRRVNNGSFSGTVQSCKFLFTEEGKPSILYCIKAHNSGGIEYWGIENVDKSILGKPVEPLSCLQALAESPGYGFGRDSGLCGGALPLALSPLVGDKAARAAHSSGVFKDTVSACVSLTNPPEDFTAEEWTNLLMLLVTKCSQSDDLQELSSKLENKEASRLSTEMMTFWRARAAKNIIQNVSDDDTVSSQEETLDAFPGASSNAPSTAENLSQKEVTPTKKEKEVTPTKKDRLPTDIVIKSSDLSPADVRSSNMEIRFQSSTEVPDEASSSTAVNPTNQPPKDLVLSEEEILRRKREAVLLDKTRREKKREEALMGHYVSNRLKSTASSFEEDFLSTVVKSTLCNQEEGLDLIAVSCREPCHYCGLSDVALGAPLCRTPNEQEWRETFPHAVHDRTTYMTAEIPENPSKDIPNHQNGVKSPPDDSLTENITKVFTVRVRVGGDLISSKTNCIDNAAKNSDSAMQQFLPKNPRGFQSELKFRHESNLSVLSGSITAHEMCAIAAHKSHKDKLLAERRAFHRANMTREAALACGKSVPIGTDPFGRSYWVFSPEPNSLFVCQVDSEPGAPGSTTKKWHRFHKSEEIASVMVCLGKDPLSEKLKEIFPEAAKIIKDRTWSTLLLGRRSSRELEAAKASPSCKEPKTAAEEQADYGEPFVEDEDVLVESEKGKFLWDAVVVDVSKDPETDKVNGYLVHYKNWSSRFDQWVSPDRVVEPNKVNSEVQEEVLQDFNTANDESPPLLEEMFAFKFLNAKKRARSTPVSKSEIFESTLVSPSASHDEKLLGLLKGAILLIEAALPRASVGSSANGSWDPQAAALWRNLVKDAQGPESLMRCILLLEDAISTDWLHSQATQLYGSVPKQWRAMGEASLQAIALRVSILDRCLKYQQKKKKCVE